MSCLSPFSRRIPRSWPLSAVLAFAMSSPAAAAWNATGNPVCTEPHGQANMSIVTDQASGAVVTWQDDRFGNSDIFAQRVDSTGARLWSVDGAPVPVVVPSNRPSSSICS